MSEVVIMPRQETIDQFIDKLFEDYEDALLDRDIDVILDYFEKHYRELGPDFEPVFVIQTIDPILSSFTVATYPFDELA